MIENSFDLGSDADDTMRMVVGLKTINLCMVRT